LLDYLEISGLRDEPVVEEFLRVAGKAEEEFSVGLQLVNGLNCFVYLRETHSKQNDK
jgi:hypothetical protein